MTWRIMERKNSPQRSRVEIERYKKAHRLHVVCSFKGHLVTRKTLVGNPAPKEAKNAFVRIRSLHYFKRVMVRVLAVPSTSSR